MRLPDVYAGQRRLVFRMLLANGLAQGVIAVTSAWLVMQLFDRLGQSQGLSLALFGGLLISVLASAWLRRAERIHTEQIGQHYVRAIRHRLYRRLLRSNPRTFRRQRKGALLVKFVGDLSALRRWVSLGLARLLVSGIAVAIALAALSWLHWPFALGVFTILAAAAGWILWQSRALRGAIADARRRQAALAANVTEKLGSLMTVQVFGQEQREHLVLRKHSDRLLQASLKKAAKIGSLRGVIDATAGACVIAVLALAYLTPPQALSAGLVAGVISIIGFLTPPLRDLGRVQEYWLAAQVARLHLSDVVQGTETLRERRTAKPLMIERGDIRFKKVTVSGVFSRINATAVAGSRIAVTGVNGSGKSTLLGLVARLYDPDAGQVLIDGQDLSKVRLLSLRKAVAFVSPDTPLLSGSLRKNLCYGAARRVEPRHLQQVIVDCELTALVDRLPDGLQARIAEDGSSLSQGERVRVALARALLRKPRILLLDETDANLDAQAVRALETTISRFPGTLLMATHRQSTARLFDTQWTLVDGKLEERRQESGRKNDTSSVVSVVPSVFHPEPASAG